jgi:hypothetical protein
VVGEGIVGHRLKRRERKKRDRSRRCGCGCGCAPSLFPPPLPLPQLFVRFKNGLGQVGLVYPTPGAAATAAAAAAQADDVRTRDAHGLANLCSSLRARKTASDEKKHLSTTVCRVIGGGKFLPPVLSLQTVHGRRLISLSLSH